jgi:NADH dehydrogenase
MESPRRSAVTGAFGFTGRAIAEALLAGGAAVVTLTRRTAPDDDPLASRLTVAPLAFDPAELAEALEGVDTLFNTYWMRFPRGEATFDRAVVDSAVLFAAARRAGVRRIVHLSVVGASPEAPTPYVRAKGRLEAMLRASGLEWAVVRPTLTYGPNDILVNNLAWALRHLPVYGMPGDGRYPIQPVHVDDVAAICLEASTGKSGVVVDAAGPEKLAFRDMVGIVRTAVGSRSLVVGMPHAAVLAAARILGRFVGDVVLTRDEILELTSGWLTSPEPPRGRIRFSDWVSANGHLLGHRWSSELGRNYQVEAPVR